MPNPKPAKRKSFLQRMIADTERDLKVFQRMQKDCDFLIERNTERSTGSCLLYGISVLIKAAVEYYKAYAADAISREAETFGTSGLGPAKSNAGGQTLEDKRDA